MSRKEGFDPEALLPDVVKEVHKILTEFDVSFDKSYSTSIHSLTFDGKGGCNGFEAIMYFLLNHINGHIPCEKIEGAQVENFSLSEEEFNLLWDDKEAHNTPSRIIGDMYWQSRPWGEIKDKLGNVNILDIGCGKGSYCKSLYNWSDGQITSYSGIDLFESDKWPSVLQWATENKFKARFQARDLDQTPESFKDSIPNGTNFFMSQSALEHIRYDLRIFKDIREYMIANNQPCTQMHLFPATNALYLYLLHGYRQYGNYAMQKIVDVFSDICTVKLYKIGGPRTDKHHLRYITIPYFLSDQVHSKEDKPDEYARLIKEAIPLDMQDNVDDHTFWALEIHYEPKK